MNASVLRSALTVWIIFSLGLDFLEAQKPDLNMLFLMPANKSKAIANYTAPVIVVAINSLNRREILNEFEVHWRVKDSQCSSTLTAKKFYSSWKTPGETTHVIFGGYCEKVCQLLVIISASMNVPFIAIGCRTSKERNHLLFPTHVSVEPSRYFTIAGLIALMENFNWKKLGILATPDVASVQLTSEVKTAVEARNWTATLMLTTISIVPEGFFSPEADREVELLLEELKTEARS